MRRSESIFRNSLFGFSARVIDLIAALAGFILVARYLGVTGQGRYSFVLAYVSVFGLLVNLGLDHIIIREIARQREDLPRIIGSAARLKLWLLLITAPLLIGGLFLFRLDQELKLAAFLLFVAQLGFRELFTIIAQAVFLGCERLEYRVSTTLVFQVIRIALTALILIAGYGLIPLFAGLIIADVVQAYWTAKIVIRVFARPDFSVTRAEVWRLFKQSLPIGLAFGFNTAFFWLDILLLKLMHGDYENGLFSSAYRIISTIILAVIPTIWVLLPHLTKTFHKSRQALISEGEFYLKCIAGLLLSCAIVIGFYSSWIITFTFGEEYRLAGLALTIVTPTLALRGIGYLFDLSLIAGGKQMILALSAAIAFTSKLILELLLIPKYSYLGASWGTLIADTIAFIAGYFFVRNYVVKYNLIRFLYKPLLVGAIVTFLLWCLKCPPLLGIPLGISSYLILLFLFGTFTREEGENILFLIKGYWLRMRGKVQNLEV